MPLISTLFSAGRPPRIVWALLVVAAAAVGVAGYLHGHLFWDGYAQAGVVGPLFLLNGVASGIVIALLLLGRPLLFALGALAISVGSAVSILISHSTSFFGFAEHRYDSRATVILVAEIVATVLIVLALAIARSSIVDAPADGSLA